MKSILSLLLSIFLLISTFPVSAQQPELLSGLEDSTHVNQKVSGAFKSTRVINAHSTEMLGKGMLDVRILHRFDPLNSGAKQFFGLDHAYMRLAFEYGLTNNLMIGLGRSTFRKEIDLFLKTRLIQQSEGYKAFPISILIAAGTTIFTESVEPEKISTVDRMAYYVQLIAGRKFNSRFSAQLSPILVQRNRVSSAGESKSIFALGGGARYKFSKRMAFTVDYHHPFGTLDPVYKDPLSVGIDIETGGHVFQIHFTNAIGMNERAYITQTTGDFFKGDIRLGFNLSRVFKLGKKKV